uniref:cobaltochelatase subunit CobN n=1 Tax=Pseudomonas viridiflava TaxID=33069 RepID=UPI0013CEC2D6
PLDCALAEPCGPEKPALLQVVSPEPWRTLGDSRERLKLYAAQLIERVISGDRLADVPAHQELHLIVEHLRELVAPRLDACGPAEMQGLLDALAGRFVPAGPSGAPSRG